MGFTQPLIEMNTKSRKIMFPGSRGQPVHRAENPTVIYEPIVYSIDSMQCEILNISQPYKASRPVTGIALTLYIHVYRVSQEECARLREGVPYGKVYRNNPKHLCLKLNGYGDNGQRKVWSSSGSMHCSYQLTYIISVCL
jgi:hypothetical protein